jgi:Flp pilus assembly pilin Flp
VPRTPLALLGDRRGAVMTEYATVLLLVSLVGAGALALMGAPLIERFHTMAIWIRLPFP